MKNNLRVDRKSVYIFKFFVNDWILITRFIIPLDCTVIFPEKNRKNEAVSELTLRIMNFQFESTLSKALLLLIQPQILPFPD